MWEKERYLRNQPIINTASQEKMATMPVAVIGMGGLGGAIAEQLVRLGFLNVTLVDYDVFSPSNLNRQRFSTEAAIGKRKTAVARQALLAIHAEAQIHIIDDALTLDRAAPLAHMTLLFDGLDSAEGRLMLANVSEHYGIPVVHGAISGWVGQAGFFAPTTGILHQLYAQQAESNEKNNLPMIVNTVAAIQVTEAVKYATGADVTLYNRLLMIDFSCYEHDIISF